MTKAKHPISLATSDIEYLYWCRPCQTLIIEPTQASRENAVHAHLTGHARKKTA